MLSYLEKLHASVRKNETTSEIIMQVITVIACTLHLVIAVLPQEKPDELISLLRQLHANIRKN